MDIGISDSQYAIALPSQPLIALGVGGLTVRERMVIAVDLDHELGRVAGEIRNVGTDWSLSADIELERPQSLPQAPFA